MKYLYAVNDEIELKKYSKFIDKYISKIDEYIKYLKENFKVIDLPEFVVLSNFDMATKVFREISIPAYTNETRMIITPEIEVWKKIYLRQLDVYDKSQYYKFIENHYNEKFSENFILQIIGHELAHQSELFLDDFEDDWLYGIWFEEGMVEYLSRKYFFTEEEYLREKQSN